MTYKRLGSIRVVVVLVLALAAAGQAWAQAPLTPAQSKPEPAPSWLVYHFFFQQVLAFDSKADEMDRSGQSGADVRKYFRDKAKLTPDEAQMLNKVAAACETQVRTLDMQAQAIIAAYRAGLPKNANDPKPEAPKELGKMQDLRDKSIKDSIDALKAALGEQSFKKLDDYVQKEFAPHVHVARIGEPAPKPPGNGKP